MKKEKEIKWMGEKEVMNLKTNRKEKWRKKSKLNGWEKKEVMNLETNRK